MEKIEKIEVPESLSGERIDKVLVELLSGYSRSFLQRCIRDNRIKINGNTCEPKASVFEGNKIEIIWAEEKILRVQKEIDLDIIYEDKSIMVISKPPGMVVHPAPGNWDGTLVNALLGHDQASFNKMSEDTVRPGIVHRLDKDTSGLIVVGKTSSATHKLTDSFKKKEIQKLYLTLVLGKFNRSSGTLHSMIKRSSHHRQKMAVSKDKNKGKEAITNYNVITSNDVVSLVKVGLDTGRTHQIRVHMAHIKHPVVGDNKYGHTKFNKRYNIPRQMLHAWRLSLPHPDTGEIMSFKAPLPEDFIEIAQQFAIEIR